MAVSLIHVAIIVACIAPYRTLFLRERNPTASPFGPRTNHAVKNRSFKLWTSTREEDIGASRAPSNLAPWVDRERETGIQDACNPPKVGAENISECPHLGVIPSVTNSMDGPSLSQRNQEEIDELKEIQKHIISTMPKVYIQQ